MAIFLNLLHANSWYYKLNMLAFFQFRDFQNLRISKINIPLILIPVIAWLDSSGIGITVFSEVNVGINFSNFLWSSRFSGKNFKNF